MKYANGTLVVTISVDNIEVESADTFDIVDAVFPTYSGLIKNSVFNGTVCDKKEE